MISNEIVNYQNLSEMIDSLIYDRLLLDEMGKKALALAPQDVEEKIYREIKTITE
jgi:hypothetical protein